MIDNELVDGIDYVICAICGEKQNEITNGHLKKHDITLKK